MGKLFSCHCGRRKRRGSDEDEDPRQQVTTSRQTVIEVSIPREHSGVIIGRQGVTIKEIQAKSGAKVHFKDDTSPSKDSDTRTIIIRGTRESATQAELLIHKIISEIPETHTEEIYVPVRALGRIIGRNGDNIRQMSSTSRAKIYIERKGDERDPNGQKLVHITGSTAQIDLAKTLVEEKVQEEEEFRAKAAVLAANRERRTKHRKNAAEDSNVPKEEPLQETDSTPMQSDRVSGDSEWLDQQDTPFMQMYISAVDTPGHFWGQILNRRSTDLDQQTQEMTEYYSIGLGQDSIPESLAVGDIIAARFEHDQLWYRAKVINLLPGDRVDLYYVDFGDNGVVQRDRVRALRGDFLGLPFQAIECFLANVKPKGETWSEESCEVFETLTSCAQWKVMMTKTIKYQETESGLVPCLHIIDTNTEQDTDINAELVRRGYAEWDPEPPNASKSGRVDFSQFLLMPRESDYDDNGEGHQGRLPRLGRLSYKRTWALSDFDTSNFGSYNLQSSMLTRHQDAEPESQVRSDFSDASSPHVEESEMTGVGRYTDADTSDREVPSAPYPEIVSDPDSYHGDKTELTSLLIHRHRNSGDKVVTFADNVDSISSEQDELVNRPEPLYDVNEKAVIFVDNVHSISSEHMANTMQTLHEEDEIVEFENVDSTGYTHTHTVVDNRTVHTHIAPITEHTIQPFPGDFMQDSEGVVYSPTDQICDNQLPVQKHITIVDTHESFDPGIEPISVHTPPVKFDDSAEYLDDFYSPVMSDSDNIDSGLDVLSPDSTSTVPDSFLDTLQFTDIDSGYIVPHEQTEPMDSGEMYISDEEFQPAVSMRPQDIILLDDLTHVDENDEMYFDEPKTPTNKLTDSDEEDDHIEINTYDDEKTPTTDDGVFNLNDRQAFSNFVPFRQKELSFEETSDHEEIYEEDEGPRNYVPFEQKQLSDEDRYSDQADNDDDDDGQGPRNYITFTQKELSSVEAPASEHSSDDDEGPRNYVPFTQKQLSSDESSDIEEQLDGDQGPRNYVPFEPKQLSSDNAPDSDDQSDDDQGPRNYVPFEPKQLSPDSAHDSVEQCDDDQGPGNYVPFSQRQLSSDEAPASEEQLDDDQGSCDYFSLEPKQLSPDEAPDSEHSDDDQGPRNYVPFAQKQLSSDEAPDMEEQLDDDQGARNYVPFEPKQLSPDSAHYSAEPSDDDQGPRNFVPFTKRQLSSDEAPDYEEPDDDQGPRNYVPFTKGHPSPGETPEGQSEDDEGPHNFVPFEQKQLSSNDEADPVEEAFDGSRNYVPFEQKHISSDEQMSSNEDGDDEDDVPSTRNYVPFTKKQLSFDEESDNGPIPTNYVPFTSKSSDLDKEPFTQDFDKSNDINVRTLDVDDTLVIPLLDEQSTQLDTNDLEQIMTDFDNQSLDSGIIGDPYITESDQGEVIHKQVTDEIGTDLPTTDQTFTEIDLTPGDKDPIVDDAIQTGGDPQLSEFDMILQDMIDALKFKTDSSEEDETETHDVADVFDEQIHEEISDEIVKPAKTCVLLSEPDDNFPISESTEPVSVIDKKAKLSETDTSIKVLEIYPYAVLPKKKKVPTATLR